MKLNEIRAKFLKFFIENNHRLVSSSLLIPEHDPTLMFTNAGMVQFKNIFTGKQQTDMKRAVSSQKCLRVGGKHNDLETVGYTSRHHTFFEMLGNFSFGDYFKETAIELAWNFITQELSLDKNRLSITVYHTDDEAYEIWRKISGLADEKIIRIATDDNFWSMGNTGPCGPCSEIFYDTDLNSDDKVVEIWNLVFMEFDKDAEGNLHALPKKCIDTGMGLERITAVLQNVYDNYDTDFFTAIISHIQKYCTSKVAHRIIADHMRAAAFLIAEGVLPGNEGRNYILRRLIRRAVRYLGYDDPILHRIFPVLIDSTSPAFMGDIYPELLRAKNLIETTLKAEEENFKDTLTKGIHMLEKYTADLNPGDTLSGELAFKLYDTYGFPIDITLDILKEKKINFDHRGFNNAMQTQKARSKWSGSGEKSVDQLWFNFADKFGNTKFIGYENDEIGDAKVLNIISMENEIINAAHVGNKVIIILDKTPFYAESGGQLGDTGTILNAVNNNVAIVENTHKVNGLHLHQCIIKSGSIHEGDVVVASINKDKRENLCRNHTATHLLHFALRNVLGNQVTQKGSLVAPDRLRFDFSYSTQVNYNQLCLIENIVNNLIRANHTTSTKIQNMDQAINEGAIALFGEKYSDQVRVVNVGSSRELCGGTHVQRTGEIGLFKIVTECSIAFGVRRIEAFTGQEAINYIRNNETTLKQIAEHLKAPVNDIINRLTILNQERKKFEAKIKSLHKRVVNLENIKHTTINGINFLSNAFVDIPADIIRELILRNRELHTVIVYTTTEDNKNILIVKISKDLTSIMSAKELVANIIGKSCGGNAELAQAGYHHSDPITSIYNYLHDKI
ncbi:alanine--tRNA ligase [Wolbachia pipientis]|uniref:Alanine--tRNA ligase n=1 Tax=Wolbachia pipientis TaxID=955 RepID=A0A1E7QK74_WOLPI|nr:alanine--tRNA ligase [Wolbachia pipientis]OEY86880.1 alanine--tRNA ligase [Wolbachia pipientis]